MSPLTRTAALALCAGGLIGLSCDGGSDSAPAPAEPTTPTEVAETADAPRVIVTITGVEGATGPGFARVGDRLVVTFRLEKEDGSAWQLGEMTSGLALLSGPTFNYQRVLPAVDDVRQRAVPVGPATYRYAFAAPIPGVYAPPYNDSPAFGPLDGELVGQPLLGGTYTLGISFAWRYTVNGDPFLRVGEATGDFLLESTAPLAPREAVGAANCDRCHVELRAHGGRHRSLTLCLACHTSGAEDRNDPALGGGTPGVSVDARVLFHRIHNGRHLPSVLGVATNPDGSLRYDAPPLPYVVAASDGTLRDFSTSGFPAFPQRETPMFRDFGFSSLPAAAQALENAMLTGTTSCSVCHGDPDGAGPLVAPAQGELHRVQPTRRACGSCHDDVDFDGDYTSNLLTMALQPDDSTCTGCHEPDGGALSIDTGHRHPQDTSEANPGVRIELLAAVEAGVNDGDGTLDRGEKLELTFTIRDEAGLDLASAALGEIRAVLSGPTSNANLVHTARIPSAILGGPQPFTVLVPRERRLELVGRATAAPGETFMTASAPHLDVTDALTTVFVRTSTTGGASVLAQPSGRQNFLDLLDASGFARDDLIVVDDGMPAEEYLRIQFVEGNRVWFSSPASPDYPVGPASPHPMSTGVLEVQLVLKVAGVDYSLDPATGTIQELIEFGASNTVVVSYTTDFVLPSRYPLPLHESPDLDETRGEWSGKGLVSGTYTVGLTGWRDLNFLIAGQQQRVRKSSSPATVDLLIGDAPLVEPYALISSPDNCNACHQDLQFHDGRYRGLLTCLSCHGTAGAEDLPTYVAANAPLTTGTTISFRAMVHQIHMGRLLSNPAASLHVGEGTAPHPDNFELESFSDFLFPALPGGPRQCAKCHGEGNDAWIEPAPREHPTEQTQPVLAWRIVCTACHDASAALAHVDTQTAPSGAEACAICHGPGEDEAVERVHKAR